MAPSAEKKIVVLGTGGTIAGTAASAGDNIGYTAAQVGVGQLLDAIPALPTVLAGHALLTEQVAQIDSKDMSVAVWQQLAGRVAHWLTQPGVQGIIVTHGTDTLEETAYFLQALLDPPKPVVLTCAMRPATAVAPDGPQNLLDAIAVARCPRARGVVAVCAGTLHGALEVQKVHPYQVNAFSSGDAGPIGYVEEGRLRLLRDWPKAPTGQIPIAIETVVNATRWPRVEIVMNYAGASGAMVQALVAQGVQGLVVAATGNGTLHHDLQDALLAAQRAGVRVVRASRCPNGRVLAQPGDPIADSQGLSAVKARVALMLALMQPP